MLIASNDFIRAMKSPLLEVSIKLELYDQNMNYIKEITQDVHSDLGYITVSNSDMIRRSFSIRLDNSKGEYLFGEDNLIWLNKRIKLFIGLKLPNGEIEYVQQGIFILTEPLDAHNSNGKYVEINCVDKAYLFSNNRGKFINEQIIQVGAPIASAIKTIAGHVGETMFNFDTIEPGDDRYITVPYELTYSGTDNRWDAMKELAQFAKCELFYDVYGYLRLKKIELNEIQSFPAVEKFEFGDNFYGGNTRRLDDTVLSNDIVVRGGSSSTAVASYRLTVDENNPLWANHPYSIQKIGTCTYFHNNGNPDPLLLDSENDCKWRAKFELMNRLGYTEEISVSTAPHYLLEASDIIEVIDHNNNVFGKYIVNSANIPLSPENMTIEAQKQVSVIDDWDFI